MIQIQMAAIHMPGCEGCADKGAKGVGIGQPGAPRMPEYVGTPRHGPLTSTGLGEPPSLNFTANTLGVENSLRYMGDSMNRLLEAQRGVNQTMAAHMNATVATQETQSETPGTIGGEHSPEGV